MISKFLVAVFCIFSVIFKVNAQAVASRDYLTSLADLASSNQYAALPSLTALLKTVNPETTPGIENLNALLGAFSPAGTATEYQPLSGFLQSLTLPITTAAPRDLPNIRKLTESILPSLTMGSTPHLTNLLKNAAPELLPSSNAQEQIPQNNALVESIAKISQAAAANLPQRRDLALPTFQGLLPLPLTAETLTPPPPIETITPETLPRSRALLKSIASDGADLPRLEKLLDYLGPDASTISKTPKPLPAKAEQYPKGCIPVETLARVPGLMSLLSSVTPRTTTPLPTTKCTEAPVTPAPVLPKIKHLFKSIASITASHDVKLPLLEELLEASAPDLLPLLSTTTRSPILPTSTAAPIITTALSTPSSDLSCLLRDLIPVVICLSTEELSALVGALAPVIAGLPTTTLITLLRTLTPILTSLPTSDLSEFIAALVPALASLTPVELSTIVGALVPAIVRLPAATISACLVSVAPAFSAVLPNLTNLITALSGA